MNMELGVSRARQRQKSLFLMLSKPGEVCQADTLVGIRLRGTPGVKTGYCPDSSASSMKRTAGMGMPFRLAGANVALTRETINKGVEPALSPPRVAATTFPR